MPKTAAPEYELMLLLSPAFSETEAKDHIESIKKDHIAPLGGAITFEDSWGKKRLAYPIRKEENAWYFILNFTASQGSLRELEEELTIDTNILRHLLLKTQKDHEAKTFSEIEEWNREHLPKEEKRKNEEKRAPFRSFNKPVMAVVPSGPVTDIDSDIDEIIPVKRAEDVLDII